MSKKNMFFLMTGAVVLAVALLVNSSVTAFASMNVVDSGEHVKIIVGSSATGMLSRRYSEDRQSFLQTLATERPADEFEAVVSLDDYYTSEEIDYLIVEKSLTVKRAYLWEPGKTGKLSLAIVDNNIEDAIKGYLEINESENNFSGFQASLDKLASGQYKVFALTIVGSAQALNSLSENESKFASVDVKYNLEAETYAARNNLTYSYVELPTKPDGAA